MELKVGQKIRIEKRPTQWNSRMCNNDPTELSYPLIGDIVDIYTDSGIDSCWYPCVVKINNQNYGFDVTILKHICTILDSEPSLDSLLKQKEELERKIEEMKKPKFKVGDWVKLSGSGNFCTTHPVGEEYKNWDRGHFGDLSGCYCIKEFRPIASYSTGVILEQNGLVYVLSGSDSFYKASADQIKTHLIKEAEKRGFKEGVVYNCATTGIVSKFKETHNGRCLEWQYNKENDTLSRMCNQYLYSNGKWAEILKSFTFGGREVKRNRDGFGNDVFECDGRTFNAKHAKDFVTYAKHFGVDLDSSIKIHCTTGTWREIESIVKNLK